MAGTSFRKARFLVEWQPASHTSSQVVRDACLLITDLPGLDARAVQAVLTCRRQPKPLVIVSPALDDSAVDPARRDQIVAIRSAPLPSQSIQELSEDLAIFTSGRFLCRDLLGEPRVDRQTNEPLQSIGGVILPAWSWSNVGQDDFGTIAALEIGPHECSFECDIPAPVDAWLIARGKQIVLQALESETEGVHARLRRLGCDASVSMVRPPAAPRDKPSSDCIRIPFGYRSNYFVTDAETWHAVLEKPRVLLVATPVDIADDLIPVLEDAIRLSCPLLLIAPSFGHRAVAPLLVNKLRGTINSVAIELGDDRSRMDATLGELAAATGATVVGSVGELRSSFDSSRVLGVARKAISSRSELFVWPDPVAVAARRRT